MIVRNNAEGSSNGTSIATSQTGSGDALTVFSTGGSATGTYSNEQEFHGNQSYKVTTTNTSGDSVYFGFSGANSLSAAIRFYIYLGSTPTAAIQIAGMRNSSSSATAININATQKLQVVDTGGTAITTFANTLSNSTWYRVELGITVGTTSTGSGTFAYFVGDSMTPAEAPLTFSTANLGTTNITNSRFGKITTSAAGSSLYIDDIAFRDGTAALINPDPPGIPWITVI